LHAPAPARDFRMPASISRPQAGIQAGMRRSYSFCRLRQPSQNGSGCSPEKALPFEPLVPNAKTIAAIKEARRGGLPRHRGSTRAFLKSLDADD
jgi:hypothetical protein